MIERIPSMQLKLPGAVIIPALNEAATVGGVVRSLKEYTDWEVIVVNDGSVDDTPLVAAENGARVLNLPFCVGAWGAIQAGMSYTLKYDYEVACTMDADGQHVVESLYDVCIPVASGASDVAIGVCPDRVSSMRLLAWTVFRRITGLDLQDVTSGLRAYNRKAMRILTTRRASMLDYQDVGVLLMLREAGLRAAEANVDMNSRQNGRSRVYHSWWAVARYLVETFILSTGKWRPAWHLNDMFVSSTRRKPYQ